MSLYSGFHIVSIDDDAHMREMLRDFVTSNFPGVVFSDFASGEAAMQELNVKPDLIILDYHLDAADPMAMNGLQLLGRMRQRFSDAQIVFLSAQESAEIASNTIKYGAFDYIVKNNFAFQRLEVIVRNIQGQSQLKKSVGTQRFFNYLLAILAATLLLGVLWQRLV
jgi:DNA-binding NarL/FixJ family response regulator